MIKIVQGYIKEYNLFETEDKLILAISGGADSVCLMHILLQIGAKFDLAHCNFKLRGKESDDDEQFVIDLAKKHNIKLHVRSFYTEEYAHKNKISIQMAARDLRYKWFNKLLKLAKAKYIAVAHNKDDTIETFLINLIRGTGIVGLQGIPVRHNNIIRPLLNISRHEIERYLSDKGQYYRDDSSNTSSKYLRNRIRLQLLPLLEDMNPNIRSTINNEINIIKNIQGVFSNHINSVREKLIKKDGDILSIDIKTLRTLNPLSIYLFELLVPFGFTQVRSIILALNNQCGKQFYSSTHKLLIDRENIFINKIKTQKQVSLFKINLEDKLIEQPIKLKLGVSVKLEINKSANIASLDFEKLKFPLILRRWEKGDRFRPLGMKGDKKISDFFIDNKFSRVQKEDQWLLCSDKNIVWVVGARIDDRFKIHSNTKKLYIAELLDN